MADNIMKLGLILSATDKMSRVIDAAVGKSSKSLINFQKKANAMEKVTVPRSNGMSSPS